MITAEAAKELSMANEEVIELEMGRIENRITDAANEGKMEVLYLLPLGLFIKVKAILEEHGFDAQYVGAKSKNGKEAVMIKWK
jgi:hypothetical protein